MEIAATLIQNFMKELNTPETHGRLHLIHLTGITNPLEHEANIPSSAFFEPFWAIVWRNIQNAQFTLTGATVGSQTSRSNET